MEKNGKDKKQRISDIIPTHQGPTTSQNSPPAMARPPERSPSETSLSSCLSSLSHGEHSFHPSSPPQIYHSPVELVAAANQSVPLPAATGVGFFCGAVEGGGGGGVSTTGTRPMRPLSSTIRRTRSEGAVKKAALGFRVFGFAFCLISFSVMAADRNKGWALDSFHRYIEFRYCMMVNAIGFAYSALQGLNLAYQLSSGKYVSGSHIRCIFDFAFDQPSELMIGDPTGAKISFQIWQVPP